MKDWKGGGNWVNDWKGGVGRAKYVIDIMSLHLWVAQWNKMLDNRFAVTAS